MVTMMERILDKKRRIQKRCGNIDPGETAGSKTLRRETGMGSTWSTRVWCSLFGIPHVFRALNHRLQVEIKEDGSQVQRVVTPAVTARAQQHFACDDLQGSRAFSCVCIHVFAFCFG
eukprot:3794502-Rhodomonas_salina.4